MDRKKERQMYTLAGGKKRGTDRQDDRHSKREINGHTNEREDGWRTE
jgi:hypothetical protein